MGLFDFLGKNKEVDWNTKDLSIHTWIGYKLPIKERLNLFKEVGFKQVCLWWGEEYAEFDGPKEKIPDQARKLGLDIENVHLPFTKARGLLKDGPNTEAIFKIYEDGIISCAEHGIPTAVIHITVGDELFTLNGNSYDNIKKLIELAEKKSVNIAMENLKMPHYLECVFKEVKSERLGFCYDSGHDLIYKSNNSDLFSKHGSKLMAIHLHDNDGTEDLHMIPGEGKVDWKRIKEELIKYKYKGPLTLEISNDFSKIGKDLTAEEFLKEAYNAMSRIFF